MRQPRSRFVPTVLIAGFVAVAVGVAAAVAAGWGPLGDSDDTEFIEPFRSLDDVEPDPEGRFADPHFTDDEKDAICEAMRDSAAAFIDRDITTLDYDEPRHRPESYCGASEVWDDDDADYGHLYAFVDFFEYTPENVDEYETTVVDETEGGHEETTERTECWFLEQNFLDLDGDEVRGFTGSSYSDYESDDLRYCRTSTTDETAGFLTTHQTLVSVEILWPDETSVSDADDDVDHIYDEFEDIRDQLMIDVFAALP